MKQSIWEEQTELPGFERLEGEKKTDILIIGGGLCGLLCAYFLQQAGADYILVEGGRIAGKTTKNTTAKITAQHGLIYDRLIKDIGIENAQRYLSANLDALKTYAQMCKKIECDFTPQPAYTYSRTNRKKIEDEVRAVQRLGFPAEFCEEPKLPIKTAGAICFPEQAQFNPLKFISGIVKDLHIYEDTFIREMGPSIAISDYGKITARRMIIATHYPFLNKHGSYFVKLYQHRSYVTAFQNCPVIDGMYVDEADKGFSFRSYKGYQLIGGGGHRTGKKGGGWQEISNFAKAHYPDAEAVYSWATQDCMSLDRIPYIGQYSKHTPGLYVASGFNKWGMTSAMVAAKLLTDQLTGKQNEYASVFSPQRSILRPQLFINGIESTINLLTPTPKRCPHLGCALKWNPAEHSWDCPCHGSRFDEDGGLIDNPATGDANFNKKDG